MVLICVLLQLPKQAKHPVGTPPGKAGLMQMASLEHSVLLTLYIPIQEQHAKAVIECSSRPCPVDTPLAVFVLCALSPQQHLQC